jgi:hypothetical protein
VSELNSTILLVPLEQVLSEAMILTCNTLKSTENNVIFNCKDSIIRKTFLNLCKDDLSSIVFNELILGTGRKVIFVCSCKPKKHFSNPIKSNNRYSVVDKIIRINEIFFNQIVESLILHLRYKDYLILEHVQLNSNNLIDITKNIIGRVHILIAKPKFETIVKINSIENQNQKQDIPKFLENDVELMLQKMNLK